MGGGSALIRVQVLEMLVPASGAPSGAPFQLYLALFSVRSGIEAYVEDFAELGKFLSEPTRTYSLPRAISASNADRTRKNEPA
jgi:hypothetical protein